MSSAFDSEVYAERQRLPGVTINLPRLMAELLWGTNDVGKRVQLTVEYRADVDTREWWEIRWGEEDGGQFAGATTLELCLFRAAVARRKDDERAKKYTEATKP